MKKSAQRNETMALGTKLTTAFRTCLIFFILFKTMPLYSQVKGCPDPLASNYNPAATINDGSCTYNLTNYTPPLKVTPIDGTLKESSGLQMARNFLWSLNDGGGQPAIYRLNTVSGNILQTVTLAGATNIDWEDMAFDGDYFYIGDFGNNANGARTDLKIYKFPFSSIPSYTTSPNAVIPSGDIEIINFSYGDQPQPPVAASANNTAYDCEAMFVDSGEIHLFTKNWIDLNTTHYVINSTLPGTYVLTPLETLDNNYMVTSADVVRGKRFAILLGYSSLGTHFMNLLTGYSGGYYFNGNNRRLDLPTVNVMGQAEGVTFRDSLYGYISNEAFSAFIVNVPQQLRYFDVSNFISGFSESYIFTGNGDWNDPSNWERDVMPPASAAPGSEIIIDPPPGGSCLLNISYTVAPNVSLTVKAGKNFVVIDKLAIM